LRIVFRDSTPEAERVPLVESLRDLQASFEGKTGKLFAIDVAPQGDYQAVCNRLNAWDQQGLREYETC
jgi:hypothetical protein